MRKSVDNSYEARLSRATVKIVSMSHSFQLLVMTKSWLARISSVVHARRDCKFRTSSNLGFRRRVIHDTTARHIRHVLPKFPNEHGLSESNTCSAVHNFKSYGRELIIVSFFKKTDGLSVFKIRKVQNLLDKFQPFMRLRKPDMDAVIRGEVFVVIPKT